MTVGVIVVHSASELFAPIDDRVELKLVHGPCGRNRSKQELLRLRGNPFTDAGDVVEQAGEFDHGQGLSTLLATRSPIFDYRNETSLRFQWTVFWRRQQRRIGRHSFF